MKILPSRPANQERIEFSPIERLIPYAKNARLHTEADIGKLHPGMQAIFTVDAYPNERFSGTVRQIRNSPQTVQNVVTYDAVIDVANPELKLRPGMTANVTFIYAEKSDVLRVPNAALRFRPSADLAREGPLSDRDSDCRRQADRPA